MTMCLEFIEGESCVVCFLVLLGPQYVFVLRLQCLGEAKLVHHIDSLAIA